MKKNFKELQSKNRKELDKYFHNVILTRKDFYITILGYDLTGKSFDEIAVILNSQEYLSLLDEITKKTNTRTKLKKELRGIKINNQGYSTVSKNYYYSHYLKRHNIDIPNEFYATTKEIQEAFVLSKGKISISKLIKDYKKKEAAEKLALLQKHNDDKANLFISLSPDNILSSYYGKQLSFDFGVNSPKLAKQLKKQGINPTDKELVYFGEFIQWLCEFECYQLLGGLYVDFMNTQMIEHNELNSWAFQGSCHCYGGVGEYTYKALSLIPEYQYLRIYGHFGKYIPVARAYYKYDGTDLAHAGLYSDFKNTKLNHTSYFALCVILSALYDKDIAEWEEIEGNNLPEDNGIWCNMSELNDYKTMGTDEILFNDFEYFEEDYVNIDGEFYSR